jgi:hypothetical protein
MDDELPSLEAELKALRPAPVPGRLRARLVQSLDAAPPVLWRRRRGIWFLLSLPAAAALAFVIGMAMHREVSTGAPPPAAANRTNARELLKPVAAENVLYAATDEGIVTLADGTRARRERLNYVDTITWKNPLTHASLKWSVPREEVRVVPLSFQ